MGPQSGESGKMEDSQRKGTVTSLDSLFPPEEAQKAAKRVEDAIAEKKDELNLLQGFVTDNNKIVNLVRKLPEQLSHDIMVPFGKAAFFPGRLIHTNEFLVLLGEGYYAERTSKQTVEILQRRGESLNSQVDSVQAMIKDLETEASFFNATASEVAEGLVEIREDYVEEDSSKEESESGSLKQDAPSLGNAASKDEEYARLMSRLDELEKEELAAENGNDSDQNVKTTAAFDDIPHQKPTDNNLQNPEDIIQDIPLDQANSKILATEFPKKHNHQKDIADQLNMNFASLAVQSRVREGKNVTQKVKSIDANEKPPILPKEKISQATSASKIEEVFPLQTQHQTSQPSFDSRKAFTGSIIEHAENLQTTSREQSSTSSQVSGSQSSKPVSRFKMQRKSLQ